MNHYVLAYGKFQSNILLCTAGLGRISANLILHDILSILINVTYIPERLHGIFHTGQTRESKFLLDSEILKVLLKTLGPRILSSFPSDVQNRTCGSSSKCGFTTAYLILDTRVDRRRRNIKYLWNAPGLEPAFRSNVYADVLKWVNVSSWRMNDSSILSSVSTQW